LNKRIDTIELFNSKISSPDYFIIYSSEEFSIGQKLRYLRWLRLEKCSIQLFLGKIWLRLTKLTFEIKFTALEMSRSGGIGRRATFRA
jgi:hypothetical protein